MNGLDAMATGITWREGEPGFRPGCRSFRNCNPGNLRSPQWKVKDTEGFDIYPDFIAGYEALLDDLHAKFTGQNTHGLGQQSTLQELMNVYAPGSDGNDPDAYADFLAGWCSGALGKTIAINSFLADIWQDPHPVSTA